MTRERRTSEFFDSHAADFSAIYGNKNSLLNGFINRHFRKSMMLRYTRTLAGCEPIAGRSVIDVGCGPGHYGIALARKGARHVVGIDFAPAMIELARQNAEASGVGDACEFICEDFMTRPIDQRFDYALVMGFMDYIGDPGTVMAKIVSITASKAFFSFPAEGGILSWQRKLRYKRRCNLYMYTRGQLEDLFRDVRPARVEIEKIERDFFVTVSRQDF